LLGGTRIRLHSVRLSLVTGSSAARNVPKFEAFGNKEADSKELFINSGIKVNFWEVCSDRRQRYMDIQAI